jgi:hypothetical protein
MKSRSPATRRYLTRVAVATAAYVAILFAVGWIYHHGQFPSGPLRYLLAAAPALPVAVVIWAMMRFAVEEEDEYQRLLHNRASLAALGLSLAVCAFWGLLQSYAGAGPVNLIYVFDLYWISLGVATVWVRIRAHA